MLHFVGSGLSETQIEERRAQARHCTQQQHTAKVNVYILRDGTSRNWLLYSPILIIR